MMLGMTLRYLTHFFILIFVCLFFLFFVVFFFFFCLFVLSFKWRIVTVLSIFIETEASNKTNHRNQLTSFSAPVCWSPYAF